MRESAFGSGMALDGSGFRHSRIEGCFWQSIACFCLVMLKALRSAGGACEGPGRPRLRSSRRSDSATSPALRGILYERTVFPWMPPPPPPSSRRPRLRAPRAPASGPRRLSGGRRGEHPRRCIPRSGSGTRSGAASSRRCRAGSRRSTPSCRAAAGRPAR